MAVTRQEGVKGGRPILAGTKVSVIQVVNLVREHGLDPEDIVAAYEDIDSPEMVTDALSYYDEHQEKMEQLREERAHTKQQLLERAINY